MYQTSENFQQIVSEANRKLNTRLLENGNVLVPSVKSFTIVSGTDSIMIGNAIASYIQVTAENQGIALSGKEVSLEIGLEVDGETEYVPMGLYTIQNPKITGNKISFTAYDRLTSKCNAMYQSKISYPADALEVLQEIESMIGISVDKNGLFAGIMLEQRAIMDDTEEDEKESSVVTTYVNPFDGYTYKETIGFIAGLFGKFAVAGRTGNIEFRWYQKASYEIPSNIYYSDLEETEEEFCLRKVVCDTTEATLISGSGTTGIDMQNPVMKQDILDQIYDNIKGLAYAPVVLRFIGDMTLDVGDIVTAVRNDGTKFLVPIVSLQTSFDGGLMQTIGSYGNTAEEDNADSKGPVTEMVERVSYELAFVKKLMVDNLTATDATIKNLSAEKLDAETADLKYAAIDFANVDTANIGSLFLKFGIIKDLIVEDMKVTGELVGITVSGDLIKGNTIVADKLIVKGKDGLYYKLNTDGMTTESEQTDYNSLNGQILQVKSITADKIDVTDLFAQNIVATGSITGINIKSATGDFSGKITAKEGTIATWTIENKSIFSAKAGMSCESMDEIGNIERYAFWAGESNNKYGAMEETDAKLRISQDGDLEQWASDGSYTYIKSGQITCSGIGELPRTIVSKGNVRFYEPQYSVTDYLVSIGIITDSSGITTSVGLLPSENTNEATRQINANIGLSARRWTNIYSENINVSGVTHLDGQVWFDGVADSKFQTVQTYAANMYIGASGRVWKRENSSSKKIKHDILPLQQGNIQSDRLLEVQVVQYKYNDDVIAHTDQRYDINMPGFIVEDLNKKYPICVDKHGIDSKYWSWNAQFLIPPMLDLIQKQEKRIFALEKKLNK